MTPEIILLANQLVLLVELELQKLSHRLNQRIHFDCFESFVQADDTERIWRCCGHLQLKNGLNDFISDNFIFATLYLESFGDPISCRNWTFVYSFESQ
jgi:hypothetical protein